MPGSRHALRPLIALAMLVAMRSAWADPPPKQDGEWRGSVNGGMSIASGNTDATDFNINATAVHATPIDKFNTSFTALYGIRKSDGATSETANLFRGGGKYDRNLGEQLFGFVALDLERDALQALKLRSVVATGLGFHMIASEAFTLDVFSGLTHNREQFTSETRDSAELALGEESAYKMTEATSFNQRFAIYPNIAERGEFRAQFDAAMTTAITSRIALKVTLSNRYLSNPQPGVERADTLFLTTIGYRFGPD